MKGTYEVTVKNNRVQYRFIIQRNITILRGNSATGKTTLIGLIAQFERNGNKSGVQLVCERKCVVLTNEFWKQKLAETHNSLIFIDEDSDFILTEEFAAAAKQSDCYFILVSRATLPNLPYSVNEIYELHNVTRGYGKIRRLYTEFQRIYSDRRSEERIPEDFMPACIIVEDSNSGYQFFRNIFKKSGIPVKSATGNSGICSLIQDQPERSNLLIIADGAAYGPYMEKTLAQRRKWNLVLFLPESFEWLILNSGVIEGNETKKRLANPANYIESQMYFSWERFFTQYLTDATKDSYLRYQKKKLNPVYLHDHERRAIMREIPEQIVKEI